MPTFYNFRENGVTYSFDDIFVPKEYFEPVNLWGWGRGVRLGANTSIDRLTPITTSAGGTNWKQCSAIAAIKLDGTLWLWGTSLTGDNTSNVVKSTPVTTFAGGNNWKHVSSIATGPTAAIKTNGTLWVWGVNNRMQLGINATGDRLTPVTTFAGGTTWKQVSAGADNSAAIKTDGTLWTWGRNNYVQLGINTTTDRSTPVTTFAGGTTWSQVSVGRNNMAAIKTNGTLWTWGYSPGGGLGINGGARRSTPVTTFAGGTNWRQVSVGYDFTAATKTDGTLWTWGYNTYGCLGINDVTSRQTPVTTFAGGNNWLEVSCGQDSSPRFMAAVKTDGTLWTWGGGANGVLGINSTTQRGTPVTILSASVGWKQVECGFDNMTAIKFEDAPVL